MIAQRLGHGRLIALDRDPAAAEGVRKRLAKFPAAEVYQRNYSELATVLDELGINTVDGILLDAGMSSMQLDDSSRGFSFQVEGPLDMRMDTTQGQTAAQWISSTTTEHLAETLKAFADVGPAKRLAQSIHERAQRGDLNTTHDLSAAIHHVLGKAFDKGTVTRQVFQSIRIAVNRELESLEAALPAAIKRLKGNGRLVVLTFHSGEDRIVKRAFQTYSRKQRTLNPDGTDAAVLQPFVRVLTKKPQLPTAEEIAANSRAQSAKLRVAERLETAA